MSIRLALDLLLEGSTISTAYDCLFEDENKYGCVMVRLPSDISKHLHAHGKTIDPQHLAKDGIEDDHHVTVKYGLHTNNPENVARVVRGFGPVGFKLGKVSLFQNDDADVLKVDVHSPDLHKLNKLIVSSLPHENPKFLGYHPHATIAYIKPGLGKHYLQNNGALGKQASIDHVIFSDRERNHTKIKL